MVVNVAFITGITGQDGSYLAEFLLEKNYKIYGIKRQHSFINTTRIDHILDKITLFYGDMNDLASLTTSLSVIKEKYFNCGSPECILEIYNLAAQSHVQVSFALPEFTAQTDGLGTLRLLEVVRNLNLIDKVKFYQASTSEMFGLVQEIPQKESTPFYPRSPYGVAKLYSHWIIKNYREAYNMFACSGILFNHESPRRGQNFVTRKITIGISNILNGKSKTIKLGNIDSLRDWGHARDYIEGMWLMLQHSIPDDYILSTGEQHSVREFIEIAFSRIGKKITWEGSGSNEKGKDSITGEILIEIDPYYYRPTEVDSLLGDCSKAKTVLSWKHKTSFIDLVNEMVDYDISNKSSNIV
jgi:GDPmannose 4,6-dehydratase